MAAEPDVKHSECQGGCTLSLLKLGIFQLVRRLKESGVSEKWSVDLEGVKQSQSGSDCQAEIELRWLIANS